MGREKRELEETTKERERERQGERQMVGGAKDRNGVKREGMERDGEAELGIDTEHGREREAEIQEGQRQQEQEK